MTKAYLKELEQTATEYGLNDNVLISSVCQYHSDPLMHPVHTDYLTPLSILQIFIGGGTPSLANVRHGGSFCTYYATR
jgi:hypothetical protein